MSDAPVSSEAFAPRIFGDYLLTAELGRGGMGAVFLARRLSYSPDIRRFCAVKTISGTGAHSGFVRRFHDEARAVVTLNHPGICHVFDVGIVDGAHYLAMELIEGISLHELQRVCAQAGERLPTALALTIADAVLDALEYAHERRDPATGQSLHIVHRDVSPQNVMLTFSGAVKLIDFGLATSSMKEERTVGGVVVGKVAYMAPEHARGQSLDARADVFSAAVLLYEMLTGRRCYAGLSKNQIMMHVTEGTWMPPLDDVPEALRGPLRRALAPEAATRTPSCALLQRELSDADPVRAPARELRALLERLAHGHAEYLAGLLRGATASAPPASAEVTRSVVTHVARSDEAALATPAVRSDERPGATIGDDAARSDAVRSDSATTFTATPTPRPRRLLLAAVAVLSGALTWAAWWTLSSADADEPLRGLPRDGGAAIVDVVPTRAQIATSEPALDVPEVAGVDAGGVSIDGGADEAARVTAKRRAQRPARPPVIALPDLAAQLDYLERWCGARVPTCSRAVLAQRRRVPLLDAAGLRSLREEASDCVLQCRR